MEEHEFIKKWLADDLDDHSLHKFQQSDTYKALDRIDRAAQQFKAPDFDLDSSYSTVMKKKQNATKSRMLPQLLKIAAVLAFIIGLGGYFISNQRVETIINSSVSAQEQVVLPDNSEVILNAVSTLSFQEKSWETNRTVKLHGEAFFKVAKGKRFDVVTPEGIISVLGTQFNVKQRNDLFAVSCYEGLVQVSYEEETYQLPAGNAIRISHGIPRKTKINSEHPDWTKARSSFKSVPYKEVLDELERQYGITIQHEDEIAKIKFSGTFVHHDLDTALKSITIPLQLQFSVKNKQVIISK